MRSKLRIYNTLSHGLEEFKPVHPDEARIYSCGPTVYNYAHIGNFRSYIFSDLLRRTLKLLGYKVTHAMNITDVDDKTIRGAIARGVSLNEYTAEYIQGFFEDRDALNVLPAHVYPRATEHIPEMVRIIKLLMDKGVAYRTEDGSIYFDISKFPGYGKLSHFRIEDLKAGARVKSDEYEKA